MDSGSATQKSRRGGLTMAEYIDRDAALSEIERREALMVGDKRVSVDAMKSFIKNRPAADVAPVRHGRWILEAHDERVNYRWNVTAECSECCDEQKEIWAGFFPNVPSPIARDAALVSAESVKLSNYCPNCGAKMDGGGGDGRRWRRCG